MPVQEVGFPQVVFSLQVQKGGLVLMSMKELDTLMTSMDSVVKAITNKGYSVQLNTMYRGVMT